jgi:hypothetical protein
VGYSRLFHYYTERRGDLLCDDDEYIEGVSSTVPGSGHTLIHRFRYFSYKFTLDCGIPSVTLLGEKKDYHSILQRIEKLAEFGEESRFFGRLLQPIMIEFCNAFDAVASGGIPNVDFWSRICHYKSNGSGPDWLGGWIGAFCVWNDKGEWQGQKLEDIEKPLQPHE